MKETSLQMSPNHYFKDSNFLELVKSPAKVTVTGEVTAVVYSVITNAHIAIRSPYVVPLLLILVLLSL